MAAAHRVESVNVFDGDIDGGDVEFGVPVQEIVDELTQWGVELGEGPAPRDARADVYLDRRTRLLDITDELALADDQPVDVIARRADQSTDGALGDRDASPRVGVVNRKASAGTNFITDAGKDRPQPILGCRGQLLRVVRDQFTRQLGQPCERSQGVEAVWAGFDMRVV